MAESIAQPIASNPMKRVLAPFLSAAVMLLACAIYLAIPSIGNLLAVRFIGESSEDA